VRILCNYINNDNRMSDGGQTEIHLLDKMQNMIWYGEGYPDFYTDRIDKVVEKYKPDVLFYCGSSFLYSQTDGLENVKCPVVMMVADAQYNTYQTIKILEKSNLKLMIFRYKAAMYFYNVLKVEKVWQPLGLRSDIFRDYHLPNDYDICLLQALSRAYPTRLKAHSILGKSKFKLFTSPHPGYNTNGFFAPNSLIKKDYAEAINRSKIFVTSGSWYNAVLQKHFEILGSHTLLMCPFPKHGKELGFEDKVNMVQFEPDCSDLIEKVEYYLSHNEERERITDAGYKLVHKEHTIHQRAKTLNKLLEDRFNG